MLGLVVPMIREINEMLYQWDESFVIDDQRFRAAFKTEPTDPQRAAHGDRHVGEIALRIIPARLRDTGAFVSNAEGGEHDEAERGSLLLQRPSVIAKTGVKNGLRLFHETISQNTPGHLEVELRQEDVLGSPRNVLWCSLRFLLATRANAGDAGMSFQFAHG